MGEKRRLKFQWLILVHFYIYQHQLGQRDRNWFYEEQLCSGPVPRDKSDHLASIDRLRDISVKSLLKEEETTKPWRPCCRQPSVNWQWKIFMFCQFCVKNFYSRHQNDKLTRWQGRFSAVEPGLCGGNVLVCVEVNPDKLVNLLIYNYYFVLA